MGQVWPRFCYSGCSLCLYYPQKKRRCELLLDHCIRLADVSKSSIGHRRWYQKPRRLVSQTESPVGVFFFSSCAFLGIHMQGQKRPMTFLLASLSFALNFPHRIIIQTHHHGPQWKISNPSSLRRTVACVLHARAAFASKLNGYDQRLGRISLLSKCQ